MERVNQTGHREEKNFKEQEEEMRTELMKMEEVIDVIQMNQGKRRKLWMNEEELLIWKE